MQSRKKMKLKELPRQIVKELVAASSAPQILFCRCTLFKFYGI